MIELFGNGNIIVLNGYSDFEGTKKSFYRSNFAIRHPGPILSIN